LENIEKFSLSKSSAELRREYAQISDHAKVDSKTYLDFLVESNLYLLEHDDQNSISLMHKYYDYSMRQKLTVFNKEKGYPEFKAWATKVNQPELYKAGICYRLGQYDQALTSINEAIKISQGKSEGASLLHC